MAVSEPCSGGLAFGRGLPVGPAASTGLLCAQGREGTLSDVEFLVVPGMSSILFYILTLIVIGSEKSSHSRPYC